MIAEEAAKTGLEPIESRFSNEQQSSNNISSIKKDSSRTNTKKSKGSLKTVTDQPPESKRSDPDQETIELQRMAAEYLAEKSDMIINTDDEPLPESSSQPLLPTEDDLEDITMQA